jgi:hypothetical protein
MLAGGICYSLDMDKNILDTAHGVVLKQALFTRYGLPVYFVVDGLSRRSFSGETAYADAQREFNDRVLEKMYARR